MSQGPASLYYNSTRDRQLAVKSFSFVEEVTSLQVHSLNHIAYFAGVPPIKLRRSQELVMARPPNQVPSYRWVIGAEHTLLRDLNYNI